MSFNNQKILNSSTWLIGGNAYISFVGFIASIFLMRKLDPLMFGVVASMAAINGLFEIFRDFGIGRCIIFSKDDELTATSNMSFIVNLAVGILFSAVLFAGANVIAQKMNIDQQYLNAIRLLSLNPLINSVVSTFDNHLQRRLLFRQKVIAEAISTTTYSVIATVLAFYGWGIWSLIVAQQFAAVVLTAGYYINVKEYWKPEITLKGLNYSKVLHMGGHFTLSSIIVYLYNNLDNFTVAVLLGPQQLGYYSRGYNYAMMPSSFLGNVIAKITGPMYNDLAEARDKLAKAVKKIFTLLGIIIPPLFMFVIIFAKYLVLLIVGPKWLPMILPFQILLVFSGLRLISSSAANVFPALGKNHLISLVPLSYLILLVLLIYPGTKWLGITGTSIAVLLTVIVGGSISIINAAKLLKISTLIFIKPIIKAGLFCIIAWIVFKYIPGSATATIPWLSFKIIIYLLLYTGFALLIMKNEIKEVVALKNIWVKYNG
ncbi:MAG: hypothetical protein A2509_10590 [Candidatus Edwardsbacteria bacterium RIFOXYD12_FULL_50_11]|uniref:Polysaccharide biosynthesis protein C-terminal domain-containing protein n=1 Tax=Candidatus Edwardsbacteria bacterium GWF2_54_11 TaxID=1817851 RepID=A0A1F5RGA0_9BACT|nr:MAG: hypothetical protein A2502_09295 [Candidatus Edwardsbacteria bacterium RifOxyC12_full_54_24]OGF07223.1 MAG: hypothetical protein A2273_01760 [Candidatus Edwardsbacteria bacterium RifOxyA12_full_54_48]OGF09478.1 MAG: hypothetical protein A3K15_08170 [Candidatus Edwardsbacteria bacterium GWE2_54_12]OGF13408.1 MAG: hypothetical protein A2024_05335 [Candidatus Edwardsbacteria bacterium GWF2_54_11]OGF17256.1 MAG: hypothetical protein A2509_10590 [Candidatus Edwardsbacteria bacterium RIFOXYD1